jgi:hypothetical protein
MKTIRYVAFVLFALVACGHKTVPTPTPTTDAAPSRTIAAQQAHVGASAQQASAELLPPSSPRPQKVDVRTPAQKLADAKRDAVAACRGTDGVWHCNDPTNKNGQIAAPLMASGNANAAQCGPACTVGAWWFDPANTTGCASDSNSGTSATCGGSGIGPLATFAQLVTRLGSSQPQYPGGQSVSVTQMSAQAANTDWIFFEPRMVSTSTSQAAAILTVTPVAVGSPQTITVNSSLSRGAPGTLLVLTNPTGVVAHQLVVNTTAGRLSQALVDSVGGTTVMQQPLTIASITNTAVVPTPAEDTGWATGNTVQLYTLQNSNLVRWSPVGGTESPGGPPTAGFVFYASIADPSGSAASAYFHKCESAASVLVNSIVNGRLDMTSLGGRGTSNTQAIGCSVVGQVLTITGQVGFAGGGFGSLQSNGNMTINNDAIAHGAILQLGGLMTLSNTYSTSTITAEVGGILASGFVWGSYNVNLLLGANYANGTGSTYALAALLTSGTVSINSVATGYSFTAGTGAWGTGTALTPGAIDSAPGNALFGQGGSGAYVCLAGST